MVLLSFMVYLHKEEEHPFQVRKPWQMTSVGKGKVLTWGGLSSIVPGLMRLRWESNLHPEIPSKSGQ